MDMSIDRVSNMVALKIDVDTDLNMDRVSNIIVSIT